MVGLRAIRPIAPNWALRLRDSELGLSTLDCSSTHYKLQVLQKTTLGPYFLSVYVMSKDKLFLRAYVKLFFNIF